MNLKKLIISIIIILFVYSCDDKPPPGLITAVQHGIIGELLGCPVEKCTGVRELNFNTNSTAAQITTNFNTLVAPWCKSYTLSTEQIAKNERGEFTKNTDYGLELVGFGQITLSTDDYEAEVEASEDGWKTTIKHENHLGPPPGGGECPPDWPFIQCKVEVSIDTKSSGKISLSWIVGTETKSATGKSNEVITINRPTALEWCKKNNHADFFDSTTCSTVISTTGDSGVIGTESEVETDSTIVDTN